MIETITVEDGEVITKPGMFAMSLDWYHQSCCDGPSVSSTGLRTMWADSPAHYWATSALNPRRLPQKDNPAFNIGRAAHHLLIQGRKGFDEEFVTRPDRWPDWRTKESQQWRAEQIAAGKTVITLDDLENIAGMAHSLGAHPLVKAGILDGLIERSLIFKDPESGVWLKARPDAVPTDSGDYSDLKTCQSVGDDSLQRSVTDWNYHAQGAVVGLASLMTLGIPMRSFNLVFVEKTAPWCVRILSIPQEDLDRGAAQNRAMLHKFAECSRTGVWPGPGDQSDAEYIGVQPYGRARIDARLAIEIPAIEAALYDARTKK
jgi:hypothetical protein